MDGGVDSFAVDDSRNTVEVLEELLVAADSYQLRPAYRLPCLSSFCSTAPSVPTSTLISQIQGFMQQLCLASGDETGSTGGTAGDRRASLVEDFTALGVLPSAEPWSEFALCMSAVAASEVALLQSSMISQ